FKDVNNARNEVKQDRREVRGDHQELRKDRGALRRDIHNGASKQEIFKDRQEVRDDLKEINKDRTELRHDQGTLQSARGELKSVWRKRNSAHFPHPARPRAGRSGPCLYSANTART